MRYWFSFAHGRGDLSFAGASKLDLSVYYNDLEEFVTLAEEQGIQTGDDAARGCILAAAIFHGSLDIARYMVHHCRVSPNDDWQDYSLSPYDQPHVPSKRTIYVIDPASTAL
jgi:hypothetical protein